ncbi:MAG: tRNA dihydrouridine(20/20a) synthase DusA [Burkholderiaceae bacterium]
MRFSQRVCVAPMMDVTDRHCRFFYRLLGPNIFLFTEMLHSSAIVNGDAGRLLEFDKSEHPIGLQLGGNEPKVLNQAIKIASKFAYDEVNLNCGCPSSRVLAGNFGVALMKTPTIVADCIKAMKDGSDARVSIKHRIGIDDNKDYSFVRDFVGKVRDAGCNLFYVHSRCAMSNLSPKKNRKIPPVDMLKVRLLKRDFPDCQFIANGELDSVAKCISILDRNEHLGLPGADGVMLGRAIWKFPTLLSELQKAFYPEKNIRSFRDVVESLECYYNLQMNRGIDTRRVVRGWVNLFNRQKGAKKWRIMLGEGLKPMEIYQTIFCS